MAVSFAPGLRNGLSGDDHSLLEERLTLLNARDGLSQLITHSFWWGTSSTGMKQNLYRPWISFTYWFEYHAGGARISVFHVSNTLVHLANVALLLVFLLPIIGKWPAWIVSAFAGLSPAAVTSVGWIAGRTDLWAQCFLLIFLIAFRRIQTDSQRRGLWMTIALLSYFLGMASKETVILAPLLAWLFDWAAPPSLPEKTSRRRVSRYAWLVIPIAAWFVLRSAAHLVSAGGLGRQFVISIPYLAEEYLRSFWSSIVPLHYSFEDDLLWSAPGHRGILFNAAWLLFIVLIVLTLIGLKKRQVWAVGGFWFALALFPVYALGQSFAPVSDLYTYAALPGIGLFMTNGVRHLFPRVQAITPKTLGALIGAVLLVYSVLVFVRLPILKDDYSLWSHMAEIKPRNIPALLAIADLSFQAGDSAKCFQFLDKALAVDSSNVDVRVKYLAKSLEAGQLDVARSHAEALGRSGNSEFATLTWLAKYYLETGNCQKALQIYHSAETLHMPTPDVLFDRGRAFLCVNDNASAVKAYQMALKLRPGWPAAYNNLGISYENLGQFPQAADAYKAALQLQPQFGPGWRLLATVAAKMGDMQTLQNAVQQFLSLQPSDDQIASLQRDLAALGLSWEISPHP